MPPAAVHLLASTSRRPTQKVASGGQDAVKRILKLLAYISRRGREVLEQRSRQYTLPYRDVVRAKIVLLASEGLENREIGERLEDLPREVRLR